MRIIAVVYIHNYHLYWLSRRASIRTLPLLFKAAEHSEALDWHVSINVSTVLLFNHSKVLSHPFTTHPLAHCDPLPLTEQVCLLMTIRMVMNYESYGELWNAPRCSKHPSPKRGIADLNNSALETAQSYLSGWDWGEGCWERGCCSSEACDWSDGPNTGWTKPQASMDPA